MGLFDFLRRRRGGRAGSTSQSERGLTLKASYDSPEEEEMYGLVAEAYLEFGPAEGQRLISTLSPKELRELLNSRRGRR